MRTTESRRQGLVPFRLQRLNVALERARQAVARVHLETAAGGRRTSQVEPTGSAQTCRSERAALAGASGSRLKPVAAQRRKSRPVAEPALNS
jgi:hypothetical protein